MVKNPDAPAPGFLLEQFPYNFYEKPDHSAVEGGNNFRVHDLVCHRLSNGISDAVGERLQRDLRPDFSDLSPHLRNLMDELRRRDVEGEGDPPTDFASHT